MFDFTGSTVPKCHQGLPARKGNDPTDASGCFVGHLKDGRCVFLVDLECVMENGEEVYTALEIRG